MTHQHLDHDHITPVDPEITRLQSENVALRKELEQAQADAAAMKGMAQSALRLLGSYRVPRTPADAALQLFVTIGPEFLQLQDALAHPHPGQAMLDELAKLRGLCRAVALAVEDRKSVGVDSPGVMLEIAAAFPATEGEWP
jgi:hypothetical protein